MYKFIFEKQINKIQIKSNGKVPSTTNFYQEFYLLIIKNQNIVFCYNDPAYTPGFLFYIYLYLCLIFLNFLKLR